MSVLLVYSKTTPLLEPEEVEENLEEVEEVGLYTAEKNLEEGVMEGRKFVCGMSPQFSIKNTSIG